MRQRYRCLKGEVGVENGRRLSELQGGALWGRSGKSSHHRPRPSPFGCSVKIAPAAMPQAALDQSRQTPNSPF